MSCQLTLLFANDCVSPRPVLGNDNAIGRIFCDCLVAVVCSDGEGNPKSLRTREDMRTVEEAIFYLRVNSCFIKADECIALEHCLKRQSHHQ